MLNPAVKKILVFVCGLALAGALVLPFAAKAITLGELLERPLPDVGAFVAGAWNWLKWLWSKIGSVVYNILNWTLDNVLIYIWKVLAWAGNLIKTTFAEAWHAFLYFWGLLKDNTFVDWGSIHWPWD